MEMEQLAFAVRKSWGLDTAFPMGQGAERVGVPAAGQCAVTAAVVQDYMGGSILKGDADGVTRHYWNIIEGKEIDLTRGQFREGVNIVGVREANREKMFQDENFRTRYGLLSQCVAAFLTQYQEIEKLISRCALCADAVERFSGSSIHFGQRDDILLIGEAPAKNGWRISGKVWRDAHGNMIASGRRLQKLLSLCGLELLDCPFTEAVKCYPTSRNCLRDATRRCFSILEAQLTLLSPKIVIPLGKAPTETLLADKAPFAALVGKTHMLRVNGQTIAVFPIYHPSPASPLSWKGNVELMPRLVSLIQGGGHYV